MKRSWKVLIGFRAEIQSLVPICQYIQLNPRPDCYVRELPVPRSTKLIEKHKKLIGSWLDELLPSESIDASVDWHDFERRYGFKYYLKHLQVRALHPHVATQLRFPF